MKKLLYIFATVLLSGCGIYSFTGVSLHPNDKTIVIKFFENRAPIGSSSMSQTFTELLKDKFSTQTDLELVKRNGDLTLEGEIVGYETKPVAITGGADNASAQFNRLTITIRVKYTSVNIPKNNFDQSFSRYQDYESSKMLSDVEAELLDLIFDEITDDIFNKSVVNW